MSKLVSLWLAYQRASAAMVAARGVLQWPGDHRISAVQGAGMAFAAAWHSASEDVRAAVAANPAKFPSLQVRDPKSKKLPDPAEYQYKYVVMDVLSR